MCILCGAQGVRRNFFCTYCLVQGKKRLSVGYRVFFLNILLGSGF